MIYFIVNINIINFKILFNMSKIIQYSKEFKQKKREISELSPSIDKSKYRIVTKNLVYIIGLSESIADKEILMNMSILVNMEKF